MVAVGQILVSLVYLQFAARIPLSGSSYQWASRLANPKIGRIFGWIAVWNVGLSGAKGIRTLQSISLTCGELHYSDQVILSGATRNRTRPKNCRDLRKARNLATRKYAKRRETTCGYAKGVDGINIMERGA